MLGLCSLIQAQELPSEDYTWRNVVIGGGGFVTGIIMHPRQKDLFYARTDVGGAYRWDAAAQRWLPLTDGIGDVDLTGIESLAVDPSDPERVYLAAGIYSRGKAAILRSNDRGRTWLRTDVPFKMGGNESGRFNGERLAVDPNQGNILFFGSRNDGLWKSTDRGTSWQCVKSFPNTGSSETSLETNDSRPWFGFGQQPVGIVCVLFVPASGESDFPTSVLYVAVSTTDTNLYHSIDGGLTWQAVKNQPVGLRPNHIALASDGVLYLSYGQEPGPNTMNDGAVWKFNPRDGSWKNITPFKPAQADQPFGYGAVAVDAKHPATVMVATFAHWHPMDEIFRSTNGGAGWIPLLSKAEWDHASAPYTRDFQPHWIGDLEINPFHPEQVLFTTGYGIWSCKNVMESDTGHSTRWTFLDDGLEETVPLALISPPAGAHLLSGVGDIDGFRHDDVNISPAQGSFKGTRYSNTEDLAFAGLRPNVIVRSGAGRNTAVRAAISTDGGNNWSPLGNEPTNSAGAGSITISADGQTIVWSPRRSAPHYSRDCGTHWLACAGLFAYDRVVADTVNPRWFYAFDSHISKLLVSTNGAASFKVTAATFPAKKAFAGQFSFSETRSATLAATPGREGDLWLCFHNQGLYHSTNGGLSFAKSVRVSEANSLGLGQAAPGRAFPTLYLAGKIGSCPGLFRSDDGGAAWVCINDDQHQFGSISHVTGDPRIYGRVYFGTSGRGIIYGDPVSTPARNNL